MEQKDIKEFPIFPYVLFGVSAIVDDGEASLHMGSRVERDGRWTLFRRSFKMPSRKRSMKIDDIITEFTAFKTDVQEWKENN